MNIWHICQTGDDRVNGMVTVIPKHVSEQARCLKVTLINLAEYRYEVDNGAHSYNIDDLMELKESGIRNLVGSPDLAIIHGVYLPEVWKFWYKYIYKKTPYIVIPHGSLTLQIQSNHRLKKIIGNAIAVRKMVKHATMIQFLSQGEKNTSITFKNDRVYVGPNGINAKEMPNLKHKRTNDTIRLIFIGRYDLFHKGLDLLLEACKLNKQFLQDNNVKIEMYGKKEDSDYEKISLYIKTHNLSDVISANGPVFGEAKEDKYIMGTYFLLTSRLEGLPMGYLEACSYGLPVLITEATNMGDDVRRYNNGCVVDTSVDGITNLFRFATDNMYRYEEMSMGSFECAKTYDWKYVAEDAVKKYTEIIREN